MNNPKRPNEIIEDFAKQLKDISKDIHELERNYLLVNIFLEGASNIKYVIPFQTIFYSALYNIVMIISRLWDYSEDDRMCFTSIINSLRNPKFNLQKQLIKNLKEYLSRNIIAHPKNIKSILLKRVFNERKNNLILRLNEMIKKNKEFGKKEEMLREFRNNLLAHKIRTKKFHNYPNTKDVLCLAEHTFYTYLDLYYIIHHIDKKNKIGDVWKDKFNEFKEYLKKQQIFTFPN